MEKGIGTNQRCAILLGAGISCAAGLPSTSELTTQVLKSDSYSWSTVETFFPGKPLYSQAGYPDEWAPRVKEFLGRIAKLGRGNHELDYHSRSFSDYETIMERLIELYGGDWFAGTGNRNPLLREVVSRLESECRDLLKNPFRHDGSIDDLNDLLKVSQVFIQDVIAWELNRKRTIDFEAVRTLLNLLRSQEFDRYEIFTLNHDVLLESALRQAQIDYCDGFTEEKNLEYWDLDAYGNSKSSVHLYKLHGSIDWFWQQSGKRGEVYDIIGRGPRGPMESRGSLRRASILIGQRTKFEHYNYMPYLDLMHAFTGGLMNTSRCIVIGYSFRDAGVNSRFIHWLSKDQRRRLVIISPDPKVVEYWEDSWLTPQVRLQVMRIEETTESDLLV